MWDKQLKEKAINFKGSDYVQVKDRVLYLAENYEWRYEIYQEYDYYEWAKMWVVKTTLNIRDEKHEHSCEYCWLAQEIEWSSFINKTSALENACTSSLWRAIACLWIGVIDSFASMNEIEKAENRLKQQPKKTYQSRFQKAMSNTEFMKQCLDQNDFINKIKEKYELDEFQESQLRTAYQKATTESDLDLPFIDE